MTDAIDVGEVMSRRFALVDEIAIIAARQKADLAPLNEELGLCESFLKQHMLDSGMTQVKTDAGMTYFTPKDSVTVKDMDKSIHFIISQAPPPAGVSPEQWQATLDHVYQHGAWGLLNKALNKTAAKELLDSGKTPEELGIEYSSYRDLAWRRGKSA